jgi:hypothetical protein
VIARSVCAVRSSTSTRLVEVPFVSRGLRSRQSGLPQIAANRNTPVLSRTGRASATKRLKDCPCPCLLKPIDLARLRAETKKVLAESQQNVERVKESRARYFASLTGFADAMADTTRLLEISRQLVDKATNGGPRRG